jgi:Holliday junction resolvase RusA-like endonuclease
MTQFVITGNPMGKQRPRFKRSGAYVSTYTPKPTVDYENWVRLSYKQQCSQFFDKGTPLSVKIVAMFSIPKSTSKKKMQKMIDGEITPTKKPDTDNIAKIICDSLNGIAYYDDSQIVNLSVTKIYSENPKVEVEINEAIYE